MMLSGWCLVSSRLVRGKSEESKCRGRKRVQLNLGKGGKRRTRWRKRMRRTRRRTGGGGKRRRLMMTMKEEEE
jgi:hypothetical protein